MNEYDKYIEAMRLCQGKEAIWRTYYALEKDSKKNLNEIKKQEERAMKDWLAANKDLDKARTKFEETIK